MKKALKVFSGTAHISARKEAQVIVAAPSRSDAAIALRSSGIAVTEHEIADHWTITSNAAACKTALYAPGAVFASSGVDAVDYKPFKARALPKVPTDPEQRKLYDVKRRANSDESKRARGERRLTTWLPKEAAEALDKLTGGSAERGAVQAALVQALLTCAAQQG